jgi:hypothetical protein
VLINHLLTVGDWSNSIENFSATKSNVKVDPSPSFDLTLRLPDRDVAIF